MGSGARLAGHLDPQLGMADDGGVVDGDAAVAGQDLPVLGDDHGVDLDEAGAEILEGFIKSDDQPGDLGRCARSGP